MPDQYNEVALVVVAGITIFLVLTGVVVFVLLYYQKKRFQHAKEIAGMQNDFQREILQTKLETQEETFQQIAKELHDNVGQLLSSTKMLVGVAQQNATNSKKALDKADETLAESISALRSLSKSLDKEWLDQFDLIENLSTEADRINTTGELTIDFLHPEQLYIKSETQIVLFRIIQEALQNAIKHSEARTISVSIIEEFPLLLIEITDDGKGFDTEDNFNKGMGRTNIENRARLLGGTAEWESFLKIGTTLTISLPFQINMHEN